MGLTVSRKTAKNLAVRHKNERILTVSRNKMLTLKNSYHKIILFSNTIVYAHIICASRNA